MIYVVSCVAFLAPVAYLNDLIYDSALPSQVQVYGFRTLVPAVGNVGDAVAVLGERARPRPIAARLVHGALAGLCIFSLLGQAFFTKSDALGYHTGLTSLGRVAAAAPDFNRNLAREAFSI